MKPTAILLLSVLLFAAVHGLSTYHFHHGDHLLHALQERKGNTFVIMIAKDETNDKKLQLTNARVADGLYHSVLTQTNDQGATTERNVVWARVNADDLDRNQHLLERLKVDTESLNEWPTVIVMKDGIGTSMHGPTTVRHSQRAVEKFAKPQEGK